MATDAATRPRLWTTVSLRELLLATAVVATAIGWALDHYRLANSEVIRVGDGVLDVVRRTYDAPGDDPAQLYFCYRVRPFLVTVSIDDPDLRANTAQGLGLKQIHP